MGRMRGKRVLITGAAAGIGLCTARAFAEEGAALILTDIDPEALEAARAELEALGAEVSAWVVDVSDREQVFAMAEEVLARGPVDVLINNAGIGHHGELISTSLDTWRRLLDVNLWGVLHHVYAFLPAMKERGEGQIVTVSSGQAFFQLPTWGAYASIKAGVGVFSEILSFELRKHGIYVTTVYPFMVNTGFYDQVEGESLGARLSMKLLPLYSQKPETVGRIILRAVRRRRRIEMVHVINDLGRVVRFSRPVGGVVSWVTDRFLSASE
jgi:NAD(P)-dependent dehydrogenase (short-subunit alcohol dehydrogenase family)